MCAIKIMVKIKNEYEIVISNIIYKCNHLKPLNICNAIINVFQLFVNIMHMTKQFKNFK
jgi:hypothetical protein